MPSTSRHHLRSVLAGLAGGLALLTSAGVATAAPQDVAKPEPARDVYVALGDSYSAGTGTGVFDLDAACQRSSLAYPALIGAERPDTSLTFLACGFGVTTQDVIENQVQALDRSTDFVTISVGGNDLGFNDILRVCIGGTDEQCLSVVDQAGQFVGSTLPDRLDAVYDAIRDRVRKAEVVVVGYPKLYADAYTPCGLPSVGITSPEAAAMNDLAQALDGVIADHAAAAGFRYVSMLGASDGHDVCSADPWVNGFLGLTSMDSYHPTAAGHHDGYAPPVTEQMRTREPSVSLVHGR